MTDRWRLLVAVVLGFAPIVALLSSPNQMDLVLILLFAPLAILGSIAFAQDDGAYMEQKKCEKEEVV